MVCWSRLCADPWGIASIPLGRLHVYFSLSSVEAAIIKRTELTPTIFHVVSSLIRVHPRHITYTRDGATGGWLYILVDYEIPSILKALFLDKSLKCGSSVFEVVYQLEKQYEERQYHQTTNNSQGDGECHSINKEAP